MLAVAVSVQAVNHRVDHAFDHCQEMVNAEPNDYQSYQCFWTTGRAQDSLDTAAELLRELLVQDPGNPHLAAYFAAVEMDRGNSETAAEYFRQAADGHSHVGNATAEAHVRLTFSFLLNQVGELEQAQAEIDTARSLMDVVTDPSLPGWLAMREASLANRHLEFGRALSILRQVESDFFPDGPSVLRQLWFNYMGYTMAALGQLNAAAVAYRAEAELLRLIDAPFEEAVPRRNLTLLAMRSGKPRDVCLRLANQAMDAAVRGGNIRLEAQSHRDLSFLTSGDERLHHAQMALSIARETDFPLSVLEGLRAMSLALADTDPPAALAFVRESIDLAEQQRDLIQLALNHAAQSEILRRVSPPDEAIEASLATLDILETARRLQPDPEVRARHFGIWTDPYYGLAAFLLDQSGENPIGHAFAIMERMRARTLLDKLESAGAADPIRDPNQIAQQRRRAVRHAAALQRSLLKPRHAEREGLWPPPELVNRLEDIQPLTLDAAADPGRSAAGHTGLTSLEAVQQSVADDEAMLLFQVPGPGRAGPHLAGNARGWLVVITQMDVSVYDLPTASWFDDAVMLFNGLMQTGGDPAVDGAVRLYEKLLAAAIDGLTPDIRRLVIVPDRALFRLPFGALQAGRDVDPVGVRFSLSIAPSATVWMRLREISQSNSNPDALVLADPELGPAFQWGERPGVPPIRHQGSLPFARQEGRSVGRTMGSHSQLLMGPKASEFALKQASLADYGVIHLAAHAIVDPQNPRRSGILLAPGSDLEDGLVQINEMTEFKLGGQLVVLSACSTAAGSIVAGEGPMSLARPFFLAGAATVVASLWPMPDQTAALLFERFYSHLASGLNVAAALSEARADMRREGLPTRSWAGVVVLGDGTKTLVASPRNSLVGIVVTLAAGLGVILLAAIWRISAHPARSNW